MSSPSHDKKHSLGADSDILLMASLPVPVVQKLPSTSTSRKSRKPEKRTRFALSEQWTRFARRFGSVSSPTPSITSSEFARASLSEQQHHADRTTDPNQVDRIVVDRTWTSESRSPGSVHDDNSPEKSSSIPIAFVSAPEPNERVPAILRSVWSMLSHFYHPRFPDDRAERSYIHEEWSFMKSLARWSALWLILSWALGAAFTAKPPNLVDKIFLYGISPALTVPVIFLVAYDWPRDRPVAYQFLVGISLYMWGIYYVLLMLFCGFYSQKFKLYECPTRDFIGLFYYMTALPVLGLFGLKMRRSTATVGGILTFVLTSVTVVPYHKVLARTMINYFLFLAFIIYAHYMKEMAERRLYSLRNQLKAQFRATQRAQINERKAADSKRRLTSYVFHDKFLFPGVQTRANISIQVRVPLNSALLAVQNINSSGAISKDHEIEFSALSGSLNMMRGVLNDVLDFNRMDSGTFEVSSRPFAFHTVVRSLFVPLQLSTDARGQEFVANLDPNIDKVARWAAYQAMGETSEVIKEHMREHPEVAGVVTGDHVRLNQIINNLASNATKFTPAGGRITITTQLVHPTPPEVEALENYDSFLQFLHPSTPLTEPDSVPELNGHANANGNGNTTPAPNKDGYPLSKMYLSQHNLANGINPTAELKRIVVRIEVTDTGYGITRRDMDECNLFSAFNQTDQGKLQGGKGTGLGLALVRQIVKLSGGRLGVRSRAGEGSCFWIELPLGVGREALVPPDMESEHSSTDPDINKVRVAARTNADIPISKHSLTMAVDTVALKNSQIRPPSERSNSAIHNIMEQGGRVELAVPGKGAAGVGVGVGVGSPGYIPSPLSSPVILAADVTGDGGSSTDVPSTPVNGLRASGAISARPTYLPMPSPKRFIRDAFPTGSSQSNNSTNSSPLMQFDSNYQGIPTSNSDASMSFDAGLSVLVVDDDLVTRKLMQRMLVRLGCVVQTAENGQVALVAMGAVATPASETSASSSKGPILERPTSGGDEEKFDIVFLDNQMPVLSGLNTVAKLREWGRTDLVVGVTGNALLEDQEEYMAAGADHVLTKPVNEQALRRMLVLADTRRKVRTPVPAQRP
ncbi:Histidine kinase [Mycena kentingensis (nom. inval.)]|nr:Histidine kinase [Mycena kentingensis (nom. inval.)]